MNMNNLMRKQDLIANPAPRFPVCLCLDTSGSMDTIEGGYSRLTGRTVYKDGHCYNEAVGGTTRLMMLQDGLRSFLDYVRRDEIARYSADISIVTFDDKAKCILDFDSIERQQVPTLYTGNEQTVMGEGINLALDHLEKRVQEYYNSGIDSYPPLLVIMTDGEPNGSVSELFRAERRVNELKNTSRFMVWPYLVGNETGLSNYALEGFGNVHRLNSTQFPRFFEELSRSITIVSQSIPGERIPIDQPDFNTL